MRFVPRFKNIYSYVPRSALTNAAIWNYTTNPLAHKHKPVPTIQGTLENENTGPGSH